MKETENNKEELSFIASFANRIYIHVPGIDELKTIKEVPAFIVSIVDKFRITGHGRVRLFYDQKSISAGNISLELAPGTQVFTFIEGGIVNIHSTLERPEDYATCPKCDNIWKTRASRPKQCPRCHKLLEKYSNDEISWAGWMAEHRSLHWLIDTTATPIIIDKDSLKEMIEEVRKTNPAVVFNIPDEMETSEQ